MRIIYDEEQRRLEKKNQEKEYEAALEEHCERYKDLLRTLRRMNDLLVSKQEPRKSIIVLKSIGLIVLGVAVGFLIAYFGL